MSLLLLSAMLVPALASHAGEPEVTWELKESSLSGAAGATVQLELKAAIPKGFHLFSSKKPAEYGDETIPILPTEFEVEPAWLKVGKTTYSTPKLMKEESSGKQVEIFEESASFTVPLQISKTAKSGEFSGALTANYQFCNDKMCLPGTKKFEFKLKVTGGGLSSFTGLGPKKNSAAGKKVEWSLKESKLSAARGQTIKVEVQGGIPSGFHVYSTKTVEEYGADVVLAPTTFAIAPAEVLTLNGKATNPPPHLVKDPFGSNAMIETFENNASFSVPVQVSKDAKPGEYAATLTVKAQMCDEKNCVDSNADLEFTLNVTDAPIVNEAPVKVTNGGAERDKIASEIQRARQEGLGAYLLLALGGGLTALLTPCVFPMIPITVSFFTKRKQVSRNRSIRDAFIYSLGIIFTFTGLGFIFALLLGASGITDFATNPWVNLGVATVFVVLAGSLFGWYEIQLPVSILNKLNSKANEGDGILSVLLMGLVFSLTSFTCTVPFVGGVMVAATQGDWLWPLLGMLVFSTVFSAPFFALALFPAALKSLPKSGGWLNSVKVVMGFLEIAAALKFMSNADLVWQWGILTRNVFLGIWVALAVLTTLYLIGKIRFAHDTPLKGMSSLRIISATSFASIAVFLTGGMLGWNSLYLLEAYPPGKEYASSGEGWVDDLDVGLDLARKTGKPLFIDFTGFT